MVINQDTVLVEAVKRFRDQQAVPPGSQLYGEMRMPTSGDAELHKELMKK